MSQIARVRIASNGWPGGPGLNTVYFCRGSDAGADPTQPILAADAQLAHDRVRAVWGNMIQLYPTPWNARVDPTVDVLTAETGDLVTQFEVSPSSPFSGTNAASFGPTPVMLLMRLKTTTVNDGKKIQGRIFLGPVIPGSDANGSPPANLLGVVDQGAAALMALGLITNPHAVVWRRPRKAVPARQIVARPGAVAPITTASSYDKFSVLRSRRD